MCIMQSLIVVFLDLEIVNDHGSYLPLWDTEGQCPWHYQLCLNLIATVWGTTTLTITKMRIIF